MDDPGAEQRSTSTEDFPQQPGPTDRGWRGILTAQGVYYVVTGIWPLVWMDAFIDITGPKEELWLVRTVGLLAAVIGITLLVAGVRRTHVVEVVVLGVGAALSFLAVDVVGWAFGELRWTYLLDAFLQGLILLGWALLAGYGLSRRGMR